MSNIPYLSMPVYQHRSVGLHYLLGYALAHPEHSAQWVAALTRLLAREVRHG